MGSAFNLSTRSFTGSKLYGDGVLESQDAQAAGSVHRSGTAIKVYDDDPFDPARPVGAPSLEYAARQLRDAQWGLAWPVAAPLIIALFIVVFCLVAAFGITTDELNRHKWGSTGPTPLPRETVLATELLFTFPHDRNNFTAPPACAALHSAHDPFTRRHGAGLLGPQ